MKKAGMVDTKALPLCLIFLLMMLTGCAQEAQISFSQDVKPILDQNCITCHQEGGEGLEISGLSMMSHADLMKGAQFGPMIIAGDSEGSNLIVLMEGRADPSISMPHGTAKPVKKADIETIRVWIDQGAKNN
jgi:hypothetical protein